MYAEQFLHSSMMSFGFDTLISCCQHALYHTYSLSVNTISLSISSFFKLVLDKAPIKSFPIAIRSRFLQVCSFLRDIFPAVLAFPSDDLGAVRARFPAPVSRDEGLLVFWDRTSCGGSRASSGGTSCGTSPEAADVVGVPVGGNQRAFRDGDRVWSRDPVEVERPDDGQNEVDSQAQHQNANLLFLLDQHQVLRRAQWIHKYHQ